MLALVAGVIFSMPCAAFAERMFGQWKASALREGAGAIARAAVLSVLFVLCAVQLAAGTYNPFIYFRF
jgi:hypothetical protein